MMCICSTQSKMSLAMHIKSKMQPQKGDEEKRRKASSLQNKTVFTENITGTVKFGLPGVEKGNKNSQLQLGVMLRQNPEPIPTQLNVRKCA